MNFLLALLLAFGIDFTVSSSCTSASCTFTAHPTAGEAYTRYRWQFYDATGPTTGAVTDPYKVGPIYNTTEPTLTLPGLALGVHKVVVIGFKPGASYQKTRTIVVTAPVRVDTVRIVRVDTLWRERTRVDTVRLPAPPAVHDTVTLPAPPARVDTVTKVRVDTLWRVRVDTVWMAYPPAPTPPTTGTAIVENGGESLVYRNNVWIGRVILNSDGTTWLAIRYIVGQTAMPCLSDASGCIAYASQALAAQALP